jgi:hypothetical protein
MHAAGVRELGAPVELLELPGPRALRPDEGVVLLTHPWQGGIDAAGLAFGLAAGPAGPLQVSGRSWPGLRPVRKSWTGGR